MTGRTLLVIQHVPHEGLGAFAPVLKQYGLAWTAVQAAQTRAWPAPEAAPGIIILGGPQSAYDRHGWIRSELAFLASAAKAGVPLLGVCLGAQLLAAALGAGVRPNGQKEIGWYPLMRESGADGDALLGGFGQTETVFQWHGDTFELPRGAVQLASAPLCEQQAFRYGDHVWGLQFHVEITAAMVRLWMSAPSGKAELKAQAGVIDPAAIRQQTTRHVPRLNELSQQVARGFAGRVLAGRARR